MSLHIGLEIILIVLRVFYFYLEAFVKLFIKNKKKNVKNQIVLITGAGQGLGKELAINFAKLGAKLALVDLNKENLEKTKHFLTENFNVDIKTYICDVSKEEEVDNCLNKVKLDFKKEIDILINNAGIVNCVPFLQLPSSKIIKTFEVNVFSNFWSIKNVLSNMKKNNSGHIVCISSIAGIIGNSNLVDYCASKFSLIGLMESLREELRKENYDGIKLTTICPLAMNTSMFKNPITRFTNILPICDVKYVAEITVDAILEEQKIITIPKCVFFLYKIFSLMPYKIQIMFYDFFNYNVNVHKN